MLALLNDELMPVEELRVPVSDRGFLYGDAVFETVAVYSGRAFRLDRHLQRFAAGCAELGIALIDDLDGISRRIERVIDGNGLRDGIARFCLTRGTSARGLDTRNCTNQSFVAQCFAARPLAQIRSTGARVVVAQARRIPPACLPANVKSANYLCNILAFREATASDAQEALMLTVDGLIAEGTVSNLFFVSGGELMTPALDLGVLPGVTREAVMEAASRAGVPVRECRLTLDDLDDVEEAFYTNSNVVIMPIASIDARRFDASGATILRLQSEVATLIEEEAGPCWAFERAP